MTFWDQGDSKGLQGTHMDTLKPKSSKSIKFTVGGGFFTFWAILAHSVTLANTGTTNPALKWQK
jgi:hypothetical protein